jgi:hypothetical protein
MSYEKIKSIFIKNNVVMINSKANNDTEPYMTWECTSLTNLLIEKGEKQLELEILKEFDDLLLRVLKTIKM